jgi:hypothetical protein
VKPQRIIPRRAASPVSLHKDWALTPCEQPVTLRFSWSAMRPYDMLVLVRCERCDGERLAQHDSAPAVDVRGVLPEQVVAGDDGEDDVNSWGV